MTSEAKRLIDDLQLLPKHFTDTGVIRLLVALLTEKDLTLAAAEARLATLQRSHALDLATARVEAFTIESDNFREQIAGRDAVIASVETFAAKHEHDALRRADPLPVPEWIPLLREVIAANTAGALAALRTAELDVAVRAAKVLAGLDPEAKYPPMEFIDHLPTKLHPQFWESAVDRAINNIDAETESS